MTHLPSLPADAVLHEVLAAHGDRSPLELSLDDPEAAR